MKEMVLLPQPRGARDLLCPALGAQICPSRSSELLYICNCLSQLRFPRKIQHLRPAPRPGKRGLGPIRAALATTHREIVLRFEAFSLRFVLFCVLVRAGTRRNAVRRLLARKSSLVTGCKLCAGGLSCTATARRYCSRSSGALETRSSLSSGGLGKNAQHRIMCENEKTAPRCGSTP